MTLRDTYKQIVQQYSGEEQPKETKPGGTQPKETNKNSLEMHTKKKYNTERGTEASETKARRRQTKGHNLEYKNYMIV